MPRFVLPSLRGKTPQSLASENPPKATETSARETSLLSKESGPFPENAVSEESTLSTNDTLSIETLPLSRETLIGKLPSEVKQPLTPFKETWSNVDSFLFDKGPPSLVKEDIYRSEETINETSGLEFYNKNFITHNDSGDGPSLYVFNENGDLIKTIDLNKDANFEIENNVKIKSTRYSRSYYFF